MVSSEPSLTYFIENAFNSACNPFRLVGMKISHVIAEKNGLILPFLNLFKHNHWLNIGMQMLTLVFHFHVGCMHLMSTATLTSQCLFCFMVGSDSFICCEILSICILLCTTDVLVFMAVIHYFLSPLLIAHGFIPVLLSNLLFMVAASYYHYLNFLGYDGKLW